MGDDAARRALAAEAAALHALSHPSFPRCFDEVIDGDRPHIVLELVEGPRLSTLIRRQCRLGVEQAIPLVLQIASAIHYLSTTGVVHLDVKPKNVLMAPPPRLIDLSVARSVEGARATRHPVGTDRYMAPEQCGTGSARDRSCHRRVGARRHHPRVPRGVPPLPRRRPHRERSGSVPATRGRTDASAPRCARTPRVPDPSVHGTETWRPPHGGRDRARTRPVDRGDPPQPILGRVRVRAWRPRRDRERKLTPDSWGAHGHWLRSNQEAEVGLPKE